jgi:putative colanic acid biosynthesis UDP-glucose lipid carrier transferase
LDIGVKLLLPGPIIFKQCRYGLDGQDIRKLIEGTMLRHKVKPGITGWAQVNGLRGETETLDKMRARIQYDIDYMRNGSLLFDLMIIGKTLAVVWRDQNAY